MKKFVIALMVTATSAIGFAQTGPATPHGRGHRAGFARMAAKLNLTDAQKQQLKDIRTASREQNHQLYADFHAKLQELRTLKEANDPKADDVKAELKAMRPQIAAARKASREAMLNILTPEQRDQLKAAARQSHRFGRRMAAERGIRAAVGNLNLSDAQKAQLKQLRATTHEQNAQLFADLRATRQELRSLRGTDDARTAELKAHLESLRPQVEAARQEKHEAFVNVLTPEQRTQLEQWKAQRQSRRESR